MYRRVVILLTCLMLLTLQGCASLGAEPWQRDVLAKPEMALDAHAVTLGLDDHIYFSKEAMSGGRGFAGGGCGCN